MLRRTTLVMALAVGALATGLAVTVPDKGTPLNLVAAQDGQLTPAKPTTFTVVTPGKAISPRTSPVTPVKVGRFVTTPPRPATPVKVGQFKTIQLREITPTQARRARVVPNLLGQLKQIPITRQVPTGTCAISGGGGLFNNPYDFDVSGTAWYRTVPGSPGFYEWFQFAYKLDGLGVGTGDHSNASIRMHEAGTPKFENVSPNDRRLGMWYYVTPTSPVYTRTTSSVNLEFTGTFDRSRRDDPSCTARTGRL